MNPATSAIPKRDDFGFWLSWAIFAGMAGTIAYHTGGSILVAWLI